MSTPATPNSTTRPIPWSDKYTIEPTTYPAERETRMIQHLDDFFWKAFFYLRMGCIEGDYLEFGCGSNVRSFRLAAKYKSLEYQSPRLFAFDSFQGLPEPKGLDIHPLWQKGSMAVSLDQFHDVMRQQNIQEDAYAAVPGFFNTTLHGHLPPEYGIKKAAMVFVDCDLYESTHDVLEFVGGIMTPGSILAFDDWYCYGGNPEKGEQMAFHEFQRRQPDLRFADFLTFGWHGRSFLVHTRTTSTITNAATPQEATPQKGEREFQ